MKRVHIVMIVTALSILMMLSSCQTKSEAEALAATEKIAKETFESKETVQANKELADISIYLPKNIHIEEETANNILLKRGEQLFIVFYNDLEAATSELHFNAAKKQNEETLLLKSFKDDHKLGYVLVRPEEDDQTYELQVGIGGVKISTITTRKNLESHTEELMKISRSIIDDATDRQDD